MIMKLRIEMVPTSFALVRFYLVKEVLSDFFLFRLIR